MTNEAQSAIISITDCRLCAKTPILAQPNIAAGKIEVTLWHPKTAKRPRTNDEVLTPVATYSARGNQTIVRKSNDLIQNAMYSLTLSQQKLMLHIFAMIKPSDTELPRYEMSIYEFLKLCGVDPHNGSMYKQVKKNIEDIANAKVQWIRLAGTQKSRCSAG